MKKDKRAEYLDIFARSDIFKSLDRDTAADILSERAECVNIAKDGIIKEEKRLCCLVSGAASVTVRGYSGTTVKNLSGGEVFGCAALFGGNSVTDITALTDCVLMCVSEEDVTDIFTDHPSVALDYIRFLSDKIRFLNGRINDFTSGALEDRLFRFLSGNSEDGRVNMPMTELAKRMGIGRTSLYRALDTLESKGKITRNGKTVTVITERNDG